MNTNVVTVEVEPLNKRYEMSVKILNCIIRATHDKNDELLDKVWDLLFGSHDWSQTQLESFGFVFEGEEE